MVPLAASDRTAPHGHLRLKGRDREELEGHAIASAADRWTSGTPHALPLSLAASLHLAPALAQRTHGVLFMTYLSVIGITGVSIVVVDPGPVSLLLGP